MGTSRALRSAPHIGWERAAAAFGAPFFDAVRGELGAFREFPDAAALNALLAARSPSLCNAGGVPLRFVDAGAPGAGTARRGYEELVHEAGRIAFRAGSWHDFFNAMAWLAWPRTKAQLNAAHLRETRREPDAACSTAGRGATRGAARDAATLFDEAGAVIACGDDELAELIRGFRWKELFVSRRGAVRDRLRCYVVGHSLMDKALSPYKGMTAQALLIPVARDFFALDLAGQVALLDAALADWFAGPPPPGATGRFAPLPLMGLPGFCGANAEPSYYDDADVFRPGRMRAPERHGGESPVGRR